jgi:hypothetical protein
MTAERQKLWTAYQARQAAGALPGQLSVGGFGGLGVALSSHPVAVTLTAQRHVRMIREIDLKLDDPICVKTLYPEGAVPAKPKPSWCYRHLDFGLLDESASHLAVLEYGPN